VTEAQSNEQQRAQAEMQAFLANVTERQAELLTEWKELWGRMMPKDAIPWAPGSPLAMRFDGFEAFAMMKVAEMQIAASVLGERIVAIRGNRERTVLLTDRFGRPLVVA
jgi:hypothetical protein